MQEGDVEPGRKEIEQNVQNKYDLQRLGGDAELGKYDGIARQRPAGNGGRGNGQDRHDEHRHNDPRDRYFDLIAFRHIQRAYHKIDGCGGGIQHDPQRDAEVRQSVTDAELFFTATDVRSERRRGGSGRQGDQKGGEALSYEQRGLYALFQADITDDHGKDQYRRDRKENKRFPRRCYDPEGI